MVWLLLLWGLSFIFYNSIDNYSSLSKKIIKIEYNLMKMHISADALWSMLNMFPYDMDSLGHHYQSFFAAEHAYKKEVSKMIFEKKLTDEFVAFYTNIWMENCCQFM